MASLHGSVRLGGRNWRPDVVVVQRLLVSAGASPGPVDGRCGRHTMQAIERFQAPFLHRPDGRVDVTGPTWRHLERVAGQAHSAPVAHAASVHRAASRHRSTPVHQAAQPSARPNSVPTSPHLIAPPSPASAGSAHAYGYWRTRTPLPCRARSTAG